MLPLHDMPAENPERIRARNRINPPARQQSSASDWRFEPALADPSRVIFLDVETTGLSWYYDELTIVGWACGKNYQVHLAGDDPSKLLNALGSATALVTFNGTLFDLAS